MKRTVVVFITFISLIVSCSDNKQEYPVLMKNFTVPQEMNPKLTSLFTEKYEITPLETTSESLVGRIDKIKKFQGHYYICCSGGQSILHFNEQGKFVSTLNRLGQGPEEYARIEDFDVYEVEGKTEVWISDNLNLKVYDAMDFSFKYKIPYPFVIHKFKRLNNSHILLMTGLSDYSLTLTDKNGKIISEYLKKEIPFLMFRPVQFVACNSEYIFQLGISNAFIAFNPETEAFRKGLFTNEPTFLSQNRLLELFGKLGTDFIREANEGTYISNFIALHNAVWIHTSHQRKNYLTKVQEGQIISTEFAFGSFISTFSEGESDDSILLYATPEQLLESKETVTDKFGNEIKCQMEDNPCIVEFF
ncbi:6-bladed beta-propeller [Parabacteroides pacaensis]|uniref:6-bladed beta-propeller n=1 Tax=Parabacteroides pacaensis TaxID=2086575 RepID=UPI000D0FA222|nr:6-bladed beta-propeller [Parabacteroides pacaensis]